MTKTKDSNPIFCPTLLIFLNILDHMLTVLLTTGLIFERQSKQRVPTLCFDMKFWSKHRVATPWFNHLPKISHVMKVASKCINRILNIRGRGSFGGRQLTIWQNFLKIHTRSRELYLCVAPYPRTANA